MTGTGNTSSDAAGRSLNGSNKAVTYYSPAADTDYYAAQKRLEQAAIDAHAGTNVTFKILDSTISDALTKNKQFPVVDTNGVFTGKFVTNSIATRGIYGQPYTSPIGLKLKDSQYTGVYSGYFQVAAAAVAAGAPPKGGGGNGGKGGTTDTNQTPPPETVDPNGWSWNLPPHKWSLPLSLRTGNVISGMEIGRASCRERV